MNKYKIRRILSTILIIALLYVILTVVCSAKGLASGPFQLRISEALCILPIFTPSAIPGLFLGCLTANWITGGVELDIILGSITTLVGGVGTYLLRKHRYIACVPPIIANMVILPYILINIYGLHQSFISLMLMIGISEFICVFVLGQLLVSVLKYMKLDDFIEKMR